MGDYVGQSVDLHLFFLRIMKEHAIFLEASFQKTDHSVGRRADHFKLQFEKLLEECIRIGNRFVSKCVLESEEIVTPYTCGAERKTQKLTGISINENITRMEQCLECGCREYNQGEMRQIQMLNRRVLQVLTCFIQLKEQILCEVNNCTMFTSNYPLLIEHILREARLYRCYLTQLEETGEICQESQNETELFWNQIMMEHALFIRGLLDPTECELITTADDFACEYNELLAKAQSRQNCIIREETAKSLEVTCRYREFKEAGTKGISDCDISSIILPLLADHVLREANHYLRLLES